MTGSVTFRHAEPVMGTVVSFAVRPGGQPPERTRQAIEAACAVLHRADDVFSLYRSETPLSRLRRGELEVDECPPEVSEVLERCREARERSGGWFDPWAMPGGLDPTGLVKGWAAAEAAQVLSDAGLAAGMVNAAGDVATFGSAAAGRSWRIGVRSPDAADRLLCALETRGAVATSGNYERGDHVIDPRTGQPARGRSATVCGPDLAIADALATGLLAAGAGGLDSVRGSGYEALLVDHAGEIHHTPDVPFAKI
jgi:FAD:protein FMN transferase